MSKAKKVITTKKPVKTDTTLSKSPMMPENLNFYKLNEQVQIPSFSTRESACFDIGANLIEGDNVQYFGAVQNKQLP